MINKMVMPGWLVGEICDVFFASHLISQILKENLILTI
jgi:hypothetical protein